MDLKNIKNEFNQYNLNEEQAISILNLYRSVANLITSIAGPNLAKNVIILKITLNTTKFLITQLIDLVRSLDVSERRN